MRHPRYVDYYINNKIWHTKDDKELKISEMTTQDLLHHIYYSYELNWRMSIVHLLIEELGNRGLRDKYPEYFI